MKAMTISIATGIRGNAANKTYSTQAEITSLDVLKQAVQFDHVAGIFLNNSRMNENFISSDCVMMDCDNDSSDNPGEWLSPEKLHERLRDVTFAVIFSKSHMIDKKDKKARPRFHVYFPLSNTLTDAGHVRRIKESLLAIVPEFDSQAKDAARFFFGVSAPKGVMFEGIKCVDEVITLKDDEADIATKNKPYRTEISPKAPAITHGNSNTDKGRVISQFLEFLYSVGIRPLHEPRIVPDGKIHRFATLEDAVSKNTGKAGSYCLHMDGNPAGWVKDYRGDIHYFKYDFSTEERREYGRQMHDAQGRAHSEEMRREDERKKEQERRLQAERIKQTRLIALAEYRACSYALEANGYYRARFIDYGISINDIDITRYKETYIGHDVNFECEVIRQYPLRVCLGKIREVTIETPNGELGRKVKGICRKGDLIVPFINVITGTFQTIQRINHEGQKCFYQGLSPKGAAFVMWPKNKWRETLDKPQIDIDTVHTVFICEGVCTALALWLDTNGEYPVYSVGSYDNFEHVCLGLKHSLNNGVKIVIVADNDKNGTGFNAAEKCVNEGLAECIRMPKIAGHDWYDEYIRRVKS